VLDGDPRLSSIDAQKIKGSNLAMADFSITEDSD
jgi:hypothetical protein